MKLSKGLAKTDMEFGSAMQAIELRIFAINYSQLSENLRKFSEI